MFAIYAVGYAGTRSPRDSLTEQLALLEATPSAGASVSPTAVRTLLAPPFRAGNSATVATPTPDADSIPPPAATLAPGAAPNSGPAVLYSDGTYVGKGSGGHGWVEVTLVVDGGLIVSAEISNCGTMYPCSKIRALPGRVIERQSAAVDWISGATDSSRGFRLAVLAALSKAKVS